MLEYYSKNHTEAKKIAKKGWERGHRDYNERIITNYFLDIAYTLSQNNEEHKLYSEEYINPTLIINTNHNILLTLGIRY